MNRTRVSRVTFGALAALVLIVPVVRGGLYMSTAGVRGHHDVYSTMMLAPTSIVFPIAVILLCCLRLNAELADRFIANTRTRESIRVHLMKVFVRSSLIAFAVFFLYAFVSFLVAFVVWPLIGDPGIDPAGYGMTAPEAETYSWTSDSYSFLLQYGDFTYGLAYSAWIGLAAVFYAVLGLCLLLLLSNRLFALALPFLIYLAGTVAASLVGMPNLGLLFSLFPFGLSATDSWQAAAPTLAVGVVASALTLVVFTGAPRNQRLA